MTEKIIILPEVYEKIIRDMGKAIKTECGGILGSQNGSDTVSHFFFDKEGSKAAAANEYIPCSTTLGQCVAEWAKENISLWGIVHTHPKRHPRLSAADIRYAVSFCRLNDLPFINMLIFIAEETSLFGYTVYSDSTVKDRILVFP